MKYSTALLAASLILATSASTSVRAAGTADVPQTNEHCETRCTIDHETCGSDVSDMIDDCENNCDDSVCSKCQETMDAAALGQCHANCDQCMSQCDSSAEPKRESCDTSERRCLAKCTAVE